jgi:probable F420-dependent oxidoreductase
VKFSIWPNPARTPDEVLDLARFADDEGWHGMWYADHYMDNTGTEEVKGGVVHECWSMLPAIATVTSRIRLGPLVAPTSVHHPALLANRAATIDQLSGGRFVLGLGAGWQINEHRAYGIELEAPGRRVSRFEEAIQVVRSLLDEDRTDFDGDFYRITDASCDPKPVQSPLPILVGTGSPRMLRITARFAQEWNTWGTPDVAIETLDKLRAACAAEDRDPATFHTTAQALVFMTTDQQTIDFVTSGDLGGRSLAGSNEHLVELLGRYRDAGFDEFIVPDFTLGDTFEERLDNYRTFQGEVAAKL